MYLTEVTPYSAARRAICAAYALATMALVGVHPLLTQVPPNRCRSMTATFIPLPASRPASDGAGLACTDDEGVECRAHGEGSAGCPSDHTAHIAKGLSVITFASPPADSRCSRGAPATRLQQVPRPRPGT